MEPKSFTRYCEEQIPARLKDDKFLAFSSLVKKRNITSLEELEEYLSRREDVLSDFISHNKSPAPTATHLREKAEELGFIKNIRRNFMKYL